MAWRSVFCHIVSRSLLVIYICFYLGYAFIDVDEISTINYGINIIKEPTVISENYQDSAVLVTSKHGQEYQCKYLSHHEKSSRDKEEEKVAEEKGVVELLQPMRKAPCLLKKKDWWTYEFCFGEFVRQYHYEDGGIRGNVIFLGHYQKDFDWSNVTDSEERVRDSTASGRFHSQYYGNGSKCDLMTRAREAEVRFMCDVGASQDHIVRVDEPETCVYVVTVRTPRLCRHPHLKPQVGSHPVPIVCSPLLTSQQFLQYQASYGSGMMTHPMAVDGEKSGYGLVDAVAGILSGSLDSGSEASDLSSLSHEADITAVDKDEKSGEWKTLTSVDDLEKLLTKEGIFAKVTKKESKRHSDVQQAGSDRAGTDIIQDGSSNDNEGGEEEKGIDEEDIKKWNDFWSHYDRSEESIEGTGKDRSHHLSLDGSKQQTDVTSERKEKSMTNQIQSRDITTENTVNADTADDNPPAASDRRHGDSVAEGAESGTAASSSTSTTQHDIKLEDYLQSELKDQMEKVGVHPHSVRVRVRMVSFGKDESDIHILSDEDTESVHRMVVAIFVGENDAVKERRRQEALEDGYNLVLAGDHLPPTMERQQGQASGVPMGDGEAGDDSPSSSSSSLSSDAEDSSDS